MDRLQLNMKTGCACVHAACDGWREVCNTGAHCSVMTSWHLVTSAIVRPTLSPYLDIIPVFAVHYFKTWTVNITIHWSLTRHTNIILRHGKLSRDTKHYHETPNIIPRHRTFLETLNIIPRHWTLSRDNEHYPEQIMLGLETAAVACVRLSCRRHPPLNQIMGIVVIKCNHHHNFILESLDCQISYGRRHYSNLHQCAVVRVLTQWPVCTM